MFTGLVEATGVLLARSQRGPGFRLSVACELSPLVLGESIAVAGACLTVSSVGGNRFEADLSQETHQKTTLGQLAVGSRVNLERSLTLGSRIGGHLVLGHVDGVGRVESVTPVGDARSVSVRAPEALSRFIASKGSVCLDGVSLTVNEVAPPSFRVMLIPETLTRTTLANLTPGRDLNLEIDLLARYVVHALDVRAEQPSQEGLLRALAESGFLKSSS